MTPLPDKPPLVHQADLTPPGRAPLPDGHLAVEGCVNFRDAVGGGGPTDGSMRRGVLWRSDDPIRITARGCATVAALGLVAVIDVRQDNQFVRRPPFAPEVTFSMARWWTASSTSTTRRRSPSPATLPTCTTR